KLRFLLRPATNFDATTCKIFISLPSSHPYQFSAPNSKELNSKFEQKSSQKQSHFSCFETRNFDDFLAQL
ncbi:unnamed protein product, partial [Prunus brigantina]